MTKVLVLGASGKVGNAVFRYLSLNPSLKTIGTLRNHADVLSRYGTVRELNVKDLDAVQRTIEEIRPDWIVNCVGDTRSTAEHVGEYFYLNTTFPQIVSALAAKHNARFIHISSNGVFSGNKGEAYADTDVPDATDLYGLSKALSENAKGIVIRTSYIGHSVDGSSGLLDWFLQAKQADGFDAALWNGITSLTLAKIIERIITRKLTFNNSVLQFTSETKSKYELLRIIHDVYKTGNVLRKVDGAPQNITLIPSKEQALFTDIIPSLEKQIQELKAFYSK